ncbi:thiamine phosphate synthase [Acidomonas methanolica]|uniref:Thiamine phosphate pyrophosphorylase n=1 Tax=Acidomonas methanolica NBRC 104435 TaxID=1231351 RepID=A0A023D276_ACIMT|nr:thiamine phosphate synthase [Acidomonas methanolica]MBU2655205.1 thiamine phosphate synthase [Acidomonas methanolica]TCS24732.1 thiamine-phosphate diphosphorylase [Acidomonas methanolica]GAJ28258.1 thiamine phosphate pyrophosphorylase [Acidomonas methanolica NBRC 104435]GBQ59720.1 thiamine monophosphate synthase [Acidomonas methanolica]GEK98749.1 thiamine-phosphate synthase [Acidomonas methanolica NBRC 104435]
MSDPELYFVLPPSFDPVRHMSVLREALELGRPTALRLAVTEEAAARTQATALQHVLRAQDIALILTNLPALARQLDCDGVQLDATSPLLATARKALGEDRQLGIACPPTRDAAMSAGEAGADYIALPPEGADVVRWWGEMMELPTVADPLSTSAEARAMAGAGVDFLTLRIDCTAPDQMRAQIRDWADLRPGRPASARPA